MCGEAEAVGESKELCDPLFGGADVLSSLCIVPERHRGGGSGNRDSCSCHGDGAIEDAFEVSLSY